MGRYRKIDVRVHADERVRRLSRPKANGYTLWLYLLSCPFSTIIPGLFRAGEAALAEDLEWEPKAFRKAFREVIVEGLAKFDPATRIVWLPKAIRYNAPESPNVVKGWRTTWDELPSCALKREAYGTLRAAVADISEGFAEAFRVACPEPSPNQEQEQEQEQQQDSGRASPPNRGSSGSESAGQSTARTRVATPEPDDDGFAEFYAAYPKKKAPEKAAKAWRKLGPDDALRATIIAAIATQRRWPEWLRDGGRYIPYPATWLNGRMWQDEPSEAAGALGLTGSMAAVANVAQRRLGQAVNS